MFCETIDDCGNILSPGIDQYANGFFKRLFYKLVVRLLHKAIIKKLFKAELVNQASFGRSFSLFFPALFPLSLPYHLNSRIV